MTRGTVRTVVLLTLLAGGCREGVPPFTPAERTYDGPAFALTFGSGNDADPRWSPGGDTLLYHTNRFGTLPQARGVLLDIPAAGGAATPVMLDVQSRLGGRPLATPAYSPTGDRIAYMDLLSVDVPGACSPGECSGNQPLLDSALLRVRRVGEVLPISQDPAIAVRFAGTDPGHRFGSDGPYVERLFPFQAQHLLESAMLFRPSWSPDGERIAFSDGLSIRIWRIGEPAAAVVPGSADGVSAAWSPNGEWIAFTALIRTDSQTIDCTCNQDVPATRYTYTVAARTLVIMRPDGSDRTELGEGEDPAWSPDNQFLYVRRNDAIVRIPIQGGAAQMMAGTERGRSPAVSPDGTRLAFARRKNQLTVDYDIWVASLGQ